MKMGSKIKKAGIFKCEICGNVVEVLHTGAGSLMCCGEKMALMNEKKADEGQEKHMPVTEKVDGGYFVKVGSIEHPMEESHFIEWIELIVDGELFMRRFLAPGQKPEAEFCVNYEHKNIEIREFCNLHGLWSSSC